MSETDHISDWSQVRTLSPSSTALDVLRQPVGCAYLFSEIQTSSCFHFDAHHFGDPVAAAPSWLTSSGQTSTLYLQLDLSIPFGGGPLISVTDTTAVSIRTAALAADAFQLNAFLASAGVSA